MTNNNTTANALAQIWPAVIATSTVAIAIASAVAVTYNIAASSSTGGGTSSSSDDGDSNDDSKEEGEKVDEKQAAMRYKRVNEHWSNEENNWIVKEEKVLTPKEIEEANKLLFIVKSRVEERDEPPSLLLEVKSNAIKDVLREEMSEIDEVFDAKPIIDTRDIFRHITPLTERMSKKRTELADLRLKSSGSTTTAVAGPSTDLDQPAKRVYTVAELEEQIDHVAVLLQMMETEYKPVREKLERLAKDGLASFDTLWALFRPEQLALCEHEDSGEPMSIVVKTIAYDTSSSQGRYLGLSGTFLEWTGEKYQRSWRDIRVYKFRGVRKASGLAASPLTDAMRATLTERGRLAAGLSGVHFKEFTGSMITISFNPFGNKQVEKRRADGRVQIDRESYRKMAPSGYGNSRSRAIDLDFDDEFGGCQCEVCTGHVVQELIDEDHDEEAAKKPKHQQPVPDKDLPLLPPTVFGYSFVLKEFGQFLVSGFSDVVFQHNAFDHLVLDAGHKTMIKALVESSRKEAYESNAMISDVIKGKGGGLIIVLHGNPGTGKTLTAEAVSETLQRPLYIVSSGSLGSNAADVEKSLQDTLEIAKRWSCVLLIDEADVFLEERGDHEMQRNSLVAVFLRMLEYHEGVLFLTTNRVKSFDPAFVSRFSVAVRYPDLSRESRRVIWRKFLEMAGCTIGSKAQPYGITNGTDSADSSRSPTPASVKAEHSYISEKALEKFADVPLNGRVIKQLTRAATALSLSEKVPLAARHVDQVLAFQKSFAEDFENPSTETMYEAADGSSQHQTNRRTLYG